MFVLQMIGVAFAYSAVLQQPFGRRLNRRFANDLDAEMHLCNCSAGSLEDSLIASAKFLIFSDSISGRADRLNIMSTPSPQPVNQIATTDEIRAHFPALEREHRGFPVAYFDAPGGTQTPQVVVDAVADYLLNHNANTHWEYPTSHETDAIIEAARQTFGEFLNASANEIVFGPNTTSMIYHLSRALGRTLGPGDEIVITELEHHANVAPWQALVKERGVTLHVAQMDTESGQLNWYDFERLISPRTKVVAFGAGCNALGTVNDYRRAVELAHSVGALALVDAVHYAPYFLCDVKSMDCDFLTCSAYKFYGPHVSVLYAKTELIESIDFPKLQPAPDVGPERVEMGTLNHEGIAGAAAAVDFYASLVAQTVSLRSRRERLRLAFEGLSAHSQPQVKRLWDELARVKGIRLYGPPPQVARTPTVSFTIDGVSSTEVARRLSERGLFVSHGDFYAQTVVDRLGLQPEGLVRVGCACYTSDEEIDRLIESVRELALGS
ncbi:MAG TPA: cysteine desulfurase-like protein [Pyrinomonadaceae bacterium]|nr:cysteine desulfurase-like protein [Pyrinomonadaceae bacterium]